MNIKQIDFAKRDGLVPVVVQKSNYRKSGKILMLAYANEEAVRLTLQTGFAHFFSTSRKKIWKKGETSGNVLLVREVLIDCDEDALVYRVKNTGPVCHTGNQNCFYRRLHADQNCLG